MSDLPRVLAIMGSGETTPTMVRVHRALLDRVAARLGGKPVPAVVLDTPYAFQENAEDISARALDYFRQTVGRPFTLASLRGSEDALLLETALVRVREAAYVFSGPGSPTYALRQWAGTDIPDLLAGKLATGGVVVAASAAALTLGRFTLPVYEIYKAGEAPHWLPGLDLLSALGFNVAVLPHYDNAEGGNHDTRFCYLGERRLTRLEADLPGDAFVLGVDGHTALVLDLDEGTASVLGIGSVTARKDGRSVVFPAGSQIPVDKLRTAPFGRGSQPEPPPASRASRDVAVPIGDRAAAPQSRPLREEAASLETAFAASVEGGDVAAATRHALALEELLVAWSRDTEQSDALDRARSSLRGMIVRLGETAAEGGPADASSLIRPLVDALVEARLRARSERDWQLADSIRDRLLAAGVELHDAPDGTTWELRPVEPVR